MNSLTSFRPQRHQGPRPTSSFLPAPWSEMEDGRSRLGWRWNMWTLSFFHVWRRLFFDHELVHLVLTRTTSSFIFANASSLIKWWVWKFQQSWWCIDFTKHHENVFHLRQQRDVNSNEVGTPDVLILVWILYSKIFVSIHDEECLELISISDKLKICT